jgi:uncharacterized YigZ family protein
MLFEDSYQTVAEPGEGIFRDRGSKFLAFVYPIKSETDIKPIITHLKSEHPKANHHCWALRITPDRSVFRVNDDGEPSGTAGRPILNILLSRDLTNVAVVVVRYFGGTLLGVPGLINAYKTATEEALKSIKIIEKTLNDVYILSFNYLQMNDIMRIIKSENLNIIDQQRDTACQITLELRKAHVERVMSLLQNIDGVKVKWVATM